MGVGGVPSVPECSLTFDESAFGPATHLPVRRRKRTQPVRELASQWNIYSEPQVMGRGLSGSHSDGASPPLMKPTRQSIVCPVVMAPVGQLTQRAGTPFNMSRSLRYVSIDCPEVITAPLGTARRRMPATPTTITITVVNSHNILRGRQGPEFFEKIPFRSSVSTQAGRTGKGFWGPQ